METSDLQVSRKAVLVVLFIGSYIRECPKRSNSLKVNGLRELFIIRQKRITIDTYIVLPEWKQPHLLNLYYPLILFPRVLAYQQS